uniref:Uncharacterized protein n=1 Tax=Meloidogyne incognita TaxID=6306 RepID=A0A914L4C6_MELIC
MEQHHGQPIHRMQHPNVHPNAIPAQNLVDHGVMPTDRILNQGHNEGITQHLHRLYRHYGFGPNVDPSEFPLYQRPHLFHFIGRAEGDNEEGIRECLGPEKF